MLIPCYHLFLKCVLCVRRASERADAENGRWHFCNLRWYRIESNLTDHRNNSPRPFPLSLLTCLSFAARGVPLLHRELPLHKRSISIGFVLSAIPHHIDHSGAAAATSS